MISWTDEEIEEDRQERIARLMEGNPDFNPEHYRSKTNREISSHVAYLMSETIERSLMDDVTILLDPEMFQLAHKAHTNLFNIFQNVDREEEDVDADGGNS